MWAGQLNQRAVLTKTVFICLVVAALLSTFSLANADNDGFVTFNLLPLSPAAPPPPSIHSLLALIALFVVTGAAAAAYFIKRRRKLIVAVTSVLLVVIAAAGLIWFVRASIYYSFDTLYTYPRGGDNYFSLSSQNTGYVEGSFSLLVQLRNASFSTRTSYPYQLVDDLTARFDYTLQPKEKVDTDVYFIIDDEVTGFNISLEYQSSGDFLVTSDSLDWYSFVNFVKDPFDDNFTSQRPPPPP